MITQTGPSQEQINELIALHNQGRLQEALVQGEALARQFPDAPFTPNLLGAVYAGLGRLEQAVASYAKALKIKPDYAEAHNNLGAALNALGKPEEAVASLHNALQIKPDYAEAHYNLGIALVDLGQLEEAVVSYNNVLRLRPDLAEVHNDLGNALYVLGKPEEAAASYAKALQIEPDYADAHNNLGNVLCDLGKPEAATASYNAALRIKPDYAEARNNLGKLLNGIGKPEEAVVECRRALQIKPNYADAHNNLGNALCDLGEIQEAVAEFEKALQINPENADAHNNLGSALNALGKSGEAVASLSEALLINPDFAEAHYNLGKILCDIGKTEEGVASYNEALRIDPAFAEAHNNLGKVLCDRGRSEQALASLKKALQIRPDFAEAHNNLGNVLFDLEELEAAVASYNEALRVRPDYADAHNNLGIVLCEIGELEEAVAEYEKALQLKPDFAEAYNNLGGALCALGNLEKGVASYREALKVKPDFAQAHSNLLRFLQLDPDVSAQRLKEEHMRWYEAHGCCVPTLETHDKIDLSLHRPLRIGLVSPDFGHHPVGFLTIKLLENGKFEDVEFYCYSDRNVTDDYTKRFVEAAQQWTNAYGLSDEELGHKIQEDRIDILFDLAGHTANNRLTMFARKPSPVQISWVGSTGTTGMTSMDYLLADRFHVFEDESEHYVEEVLRLPDCWTCYDPPSYAPTVENPPATRNGYTTFGCFNNPVKINSRLLENWSRILEWVPNSRIVLKYKGMDSQCNKQRILSVFSNLGIDESRVVLEGGSPHQELLARYNSIDIALDTSPYSGGITTCEALWMGVPVVTFPGRTFAGRHSFSHLSNLGFMDSVAKDFESYTNVAVSLANDLDKLTRNRAGLRQRMEKSPLCDGARFAEAFCSLMRRVWASFVEKT